MMNPVNRDPFAPIPLHWWMIAWTVYGVFFCWMMTLLWRECIEEYRKVVTPELSNSGRVRSAFHGVVEGEEWLSAPLSGAPCLAWQIQYRTQGKLGWQRTRFLDTGQALPLRIGGVDLRLHCLPVFSEHFRARKKRKGDIGSAHRDKAPQSLEVLASHERMRRQLKFGGYEVREYRMHPGEQWVVTGIVVAQKNGVLLLEDVRFAPGTPEQVKRGMRKGVILTLLDGVARLVAVPVGFWVLWWLLTR